MADNLSVGEVNLKLTIEIEGKAILKIAYKKKGSLQNLLDELPSDYELDTQNLEVVLMEDDSVGSTIESEHYSKTLEELELENGDRLLIKEASKADSSKKGEQGKVYFLNSTSYDWKIKLFPNQDRMENLPGKTVEVELPSITIASGVSLGKVKHVQDITQVHRGENEKMETSITIKPHQIRAETYSNYMQNRKPLPVRAILSNDTKMYEETKKMKNGEAIILTDKGPIEGKTSKNPFTRRTKVTWKPKYPTTDKENYDPRK